MSLMYIEKSKGLKIDPCGTPKGGRIIDVELELLAEYNCFLECK